MIKREFEDFVGGCKSYLYTAFLNKKSEKEKKGRKREKRVSEQKGDFY